MQESQDKVIADAMADIDRRIKEETRAGLADANSEKARVVLETEKRQRELQMERIRQLADIQRRRSSSPGS